MNKKEFYQQGRRLIRERIKLFKTRAEEGDGQSAALYELWAKLYHSIEIKDLDAGQLKWAFTKIAEDIAHIEDLFCEVDPNDSPLVELEALERGLPKEQVVSTLSKLLEDSRQLLVFLGELIKDATQGKRVRWIVCEIHGKEETFDLWAENTWYSETGKKEK